MVTIGRKLQRKKTHVAQSPLRGNPDKVNESPKQYLVLRLEDHILRKTTLPLAPAAAAASLKPHLSSFLHYISSLEFSWFRMAGTNSANEKATSELLKLRP